MKKPLPSVIPVFISRGAACLALGLWLAGCQKNPVHDDLTAYKTFIQTQAGLEKNLTERMLREVQTEDPDILAKAKVKTLSQDLIPMRIKLCKSYDAYQAQTPEVTALNRQFYNQCHMQLELAKSQLQQLKHPDWQCESGSSLAAGEHLQLLTDNMAYLFERHGVK